MAIENRNIEAGTKLISKYKKEEYRATVIAGEQGKVNYRLADGRAFKSPSSAGTAITGKACNGWAFWSVEPDGAPIETQEQLPTAGFRRVPNQKGVWGRRNEVLLRFLPEEFHGASGQTYGAVSRRAHTECGEGRNNRNLRTGSINFICLRQVSQWSLPFALSCLTSNASISRGSFT